MMQYFGIQGLRKLQSELLIETWTEFVVKNLTLPSHPGFKEDC